MIGVVQREGTRAIVYSLEDSEGTRSYVAMAIPGGPVEEDLIVLASTGQGDALASRSRAFEPYSSTTPGEEPRAVKRAQILDYRKTVGTVKLPEGHPRTGLVQLLGEDRELLHEVYQYDPRLSAWVRVGTVGLGKYDPSPGRTTAAVFLSPVALAADVVTVFFLLLIDDGDPWPVFSFSREDTGTDPVPIEQRDAYWESLGEGRSKPGTRIPARKPIPGDWVFELRTDR